MKGLRLAGAAALALLAGAAGAAQREQAPGQEPVYTVMSDDAEMNRAMARAIAELPDFYRRLASPGPGEDRFMIKYDIIPGDEAEYVWAGDLDRSTIPMTGTLMNQPRFTQDRLGDRVRIPEEAIIDWSYFRGNVMQGAYTQHVIVDRLEPAERDRIRRQLGW